MQQVQQLSQQLTSLVQQYEGIITKSLLYDSNRIKWKQQCVQRQRKIKNLLLQLKQQIQQLPSSTASTFMITYRDHQKKITQLSKQFQIKLKIPVKIQSIKHSIPKLSDQNQTQKQSHYTNRTIQSVIQRGDNQIQRMKGAIQNMNMELEEGIRLADQINIQLNRQIQQLANIQDKVKDTGSTLNRAKKTINFFVKAAQCDKCLVGLVIAILLALIAFIVLIIKKQ